jgi:hypothetical protein
MHIYIGNDVHNCFVGLIILRKDMVSQLRGHLSAVHEAA